MATARVDDFIQTCEVKMQAMTESRSPADAFALSLWAVTLLSAVTDTAGGEGLA